MNEVGKQRLWAMARPLQPRLDHRGGISVAGAPLFPPAGTFAALGGRPAIARLVAGLYKRIETDSVLRPAFGRDLAGEREKVTLFFEAWFGGAPTYFDTKWSPGLKGRHAGIAISRKMAGRWVTHFLHAFVEAVEDPILVDPIRPIMARLALALVNRADEPLPGERLRGSTNSADRHFLHHVQQDDARGIATSAAAQPQILLRQGPRLLLIAAVRGKTRAAEELLHQGVDVNAPAILVGSEAPAHGLSLLHLTPLCGALARRRDRMVQLLVAHGAQYDILTAAYVGDADAVRELLEVAPALADAPDPASDVAQITPLLHAVVAGQLHVARLLLQRGATVGPNSGRLVRAAANNGHEALTALLLEYGADPAAIGAGRWVMYPAIAATLLARGANVNQPPGAWIGLCCTGNSGHKENTGLAQALLRSGADVDARYKGRTALHCGAKAGFVQVVEAVIAYGGDVNARNDRGQTPLDEVELAGRSIAREPVRNLLRTYGARRSS